MAHEYRVEYKRTLAALPTGAAPAPGDREGVFQARVA